MAMGRGIYANAKLGLVLIGVAKHAWGGMKVVWAICVDEV